MTILRSYQASSLLPDKIIDPEKANHSQCISLKDDEEEELCEKIRETINDLDDKYISDEENREKTKSYKKRQNSIYQPSKSLILIISILVVLYVTKNFYH